MINTINNNGITEISAYFLKTLNIKAARIFNKVWPANILAKSRTESENGRIK